MTHQTHYFRTILILFPDCPPPHPFNFPTTALNLKILSVTSPLRITDCNLKKFFFLLYAFCWVITRRLEFYPKESIQHTEHGESLKSRIFFFTVFRGCILRRDCLLKYLIAGKVDGRVCDVRRWKRRKQPLDDLKDTGGHWKLKKISTRSHSVENSH